jgi:type VI secretion system protein ImpF
MKRVFEPTLLDKLFPEVSPNHYARKMNAEELKSIVARDIESLLNTRTVYNDGQVKNFHECQRSVLTYGLIDFSDKSVSSHFDREFICKSLKDAISRHEPRLKNVRVQLEINKKLGAILNFSINAILDVSGTHEQVEFDATLQASTSLYAVSKAKKRALNMAS